MPKKTGLDSEALTELKDQLQQQQVLFSNLQQKFNNLSGLSTAEKQALQAKLNAAQEVAAQAQKAAEEARQAGKEDLAKLQEILEQQQGKYTELQTDIQSSSSLSDEDQKQLLEKLAKMIAKNNESQDKIEELQQPTTTTSSTPESTTPTETEPAAAASDNNQLPNIRVFMVEKKILPTDTDEAMNSHKQGTFQLKRGTLLSIVSDKNITITAGKIKSYTPSEEERQSMENRAEGQEGQSFSLVMLKMPLALQLTDDTDANNKIIYCAEATITDQHMPPDNGEIRIDGSVRGKEETMSVTAGECQ